MENFDIKESWLVKLNDKFKEQKENINSKDLKFFNVNILLDIARITQEHSYHCKTCDKNKTKLTNLTNELNTQINSIEGRREITKILDNITKHFRKKHKLYIRRYISSIYTVLALFFGLIIGILIGYLQNNFKFYILLSSAIGLTLGSIIGGIIEKQFAKKNKIYGKF